jgi:TRAP-type C4-dicarboxylate transport system permease small subunit
MKARIRVALEIADKALTDGLTYIAVGLMCVIASVLFIDVIMRYLFLSSIPWAGEVARYGAVWLTFLGGALGIKKGTHISISFVVKKFSKEVQRIFEGLQISIIIIFSSVMIYSGITMLKITKYQLSPSLQIPMAVPYSVIPVSGIIMLVYCIALLADLFEGVIQSYRQ